MGTLNLLIIFSEAFSIIDHISNGYLKENSENISYLHKKLEIHIAVFLVFGWAGRIEKNVINLKYLFFN